MSLKTVKVGDAVTRVLGGTVTMKLVVTEVTDKLIICGLWEFDRETGIEEDEDLGFGVRFGVTGSYLTNVN